MTAGVGEIRGAQDKTPSVFQAFTHDNGTDTELELWIGGKLGKYHLPVRVSLVTPGATYQLEFNERDKDDNPISATITVPGSATAPIERRGPPHRLKAASTDGAVIICEY